MPARHSISLSTRAFTIIEVAMAMVVLLLAVVGVIQAITIGSEMLDVARKQSIAMQLINNEIENVRLQPWIKVSAFTNPTITILDDGSSFSTATSTDAKQSFALTNYTISTADDNTTLMRQAKGFTLSLASSPVHPANLIQLTYTVTWTAGNARKSYSRSGTTYYGKYGLNTFYQK